MLQLDLPKNCNAQTTYLLAVSGGVDSMVLAQCMQRAGHQIVLAHANFQLRGEESTADAAFVQQWAAANNVPLFSTRFATTSFAKQQGVSIQMAARDLRYDWFEQLCSLYQIDWIVTGHHLDDQMETFLINTFRGSGLKGLLGIPNAQQRRLRPLRHYTKIQLLNYAKKEGIFWREDASNSTNTYLRNALRNTIIPELNTYIPTAQQGMVQTLKHLQQTEAFLQHYFNTWQQEHSRSDEAGQHFPLTALKSLQPVQFGLHQLFSPYGFAAVEVEKLLHATSGKQLSSATHQLNKEREQLILRPKVSQVAVDSVVIEAGATTITQPIMLEINREIKANTLTFKPHQAILDAQMLNYPLKLRKWKKGDYFYPTGMKGKKMLSKYFKDEKYTSYAKQNQWLLCSDDAVVWVVGKRCDRRFAATSSTNEQLIITQIDV